MNTKVIFNLQKIWGDNKKKETEDKKLKKEEKVKAPKVKKTKKKETKKREPYFKAVKSELKKVKWPSRKEGLKYTIATMVFILLFVILFALLNLGM